MAYQVTFSMQSQYTGTTEADNFTIVGVHCNGSPANTTIATGVSKQDLINGVTYQVADTITGGTVTSTGTCPNSVPWTGLNNCEETPSPTPNPTATVGDQGEVAHQFQKCNSLNGESPQFVIISNNDWQAKGFTINPVAGDNITVNQGNGVYNLTIYSFAQDVQQPPDSIIDEVGGSCDNEL